MKLESGQKKKQKTKQNPEALKRGSASVLKVGDRSKTVKKTEDHGEGRFRKRRLSDLLEKGHLKLQVEPANTAVWTGKRQRAEKATDDRLQRSCLKAPPTAMLEPRWVCNIYCTMLHNDNDGLSVNSSKRKIQFKSVFKRAPGYPEMTSL